jgi:hypothetical protein
LQPKLLYNKMSARFLDLLSQEQKGQIKKYSSQRLFKWLVDSGMLEDDADKLSREQLMEAWAEALYSGKDTKKVVEVKAGAAGGMAKYGYDPDVERERLEFEKEKWKVERECENEKWKVEQEYHAGKKGRDGI